MEAEELLRNLRSHADPAERERAARLLDHAPQTEAIEAALIDAARSDDDPMVRKWSLHALGCATCKPDGACSARVVDLLVGALLHDHSGKVRRFAAGMMMHGQLGRDDRVTAAFREVSQHPQRVLRERAEHYLIRLAG